MKEIFNPVKHATLNEDIMVGELADEYTVENYVIMSEGSEVIVLGHAYSNKMGPMYLIYSSDEKEGTTVHEMFLDFFEKEEKSEEEIE